MSEQTAAKVTGAHLARTAYLYVRQSTLRQVLTNTESAARQYALRQQAIALGWPAEQIVTIDTDQGQSGASAADREGFQRLVAEVGMGRAGIVLGLEVSRLARNNADWHRLLEICALSGTLICDEDGLYDPTDFNDRLLLGLKGTMSEAELHFIRARLRRRAAVQGPPRRTAHAACRSGWSTTRPARSCSTRTPVCNKPSGTCSPLFARTGSARAIVQQFNADGLLFPVRVRTGAHKGELAWMPLQHWRVLRTLHNPRYAGAFAYGRRRERLDRQRQEDLRHPAPRAVDRADPRRPPRLHQLGPVRDQPEAAAGQRHRPRRRPRRRPRPRRARAAAGPGHLRALRAADDRALPHPPRRRGPRLPMHEPTASKTARPAARPSPAPPSTPPSASCCSTPSPRSRSRSPSPCRPNSTPAPPKPTRCAARHVERARHRADLARRRYLAVDPDNRLVADSLEADWNDALRALQTARERLRTRQRRRRSRPHRRASRTESVPWQPISPPSGPTRTPRSGNANAWSACSSTTSPCTRPTSIHLHVRFRGGQTTSLAVADPTHGLAGPPNPPRHPRRARPAPRHPHRRRDRRRAQRRRSPLRRGQAVHRPHRARTYAAATTCPATPTGSAPTACSPQPSSPQRLGVHPSTVKSWTKAGILNSHKANDKNERLYEPPTPGDPRLTARQGSPLRKRVPTQPTPGGAL